MSVTEAIAGRMTTFDVVLAAPPLHTVFVSVDTFSSFCANSSSGTMAYNVSCTSSSECASLGSFDICLQNSLGTVHPTSVVFSIGNWSTPVTVSVLAVDHLRFVRAMLPRLPCRRCIAVARTAVA